jgi:hypothetical protein
MLEVCSFGVFDGVGWKTYIPQEEAEQEVGEVAGWNVDDCKGEGIRMTMKDKLTWKDMFVGQPITLRGSELVPCSIVDEGMLGIFLEEFATTCVVRMKDGQLIAIDKGVPEGCLVPMKPEVLE